MRHLTPAEFLDLAEAARPDGAEPHLAVCEVCRRQLAETREMMRTAAAVDVPEPSPLYWDHLSARVREAVANESRGGTRESGTWTRLPAWRASLALAAVAAMLLGVAITLRVGSSPSTGAPAVADTTGDSPAAISLQDDPSLSLMADLAADLDWDAVAEAGFTPESDVTSQVVDDLSADERLELERLLKEELSRVGA
jgi:hypothetical protein